MRIRLNELKKIIKDEVKLIKKCSLREVREEGNTLFQVIAVGPGEDSYYVYKGKPSYELMFDDDRSIDCLAELHFSNVEDDPHVPAVTKLIKKYNIKYVASTEADSDNFMDPDEFLWLLEQADADRVYTDE